MHTLFISYDGMTDPLGQSQVIPYLAGLSRHGYRFTILSCDKPAKYKQQKDYVKKILEPFPIKWISIPYTKNPPVLSSIYDVVKLRKKALKIYKEDPYEMVHTRPGVPTLVALALKKKLGIKFFNDVRGFWADERVDGGMWNLLNPFYKKIYSFFKKHEYECLEKADATTCLTYKARAEMQSWKNISNQPMPIEVIPCSADLALFDRKSIDDKLRTKLKADLKIEDGDFVISYLGSVGGWYLTKEMMEFLKIVSNKIPRSKFLFISPHSREEILYAASAAGIDPKLIVNYYAKRHEVPALLSLSSYSLFFIKPCYSKLSSSPTKHGEIMAMGIPIITNTGVGDVDDIIKTYDAGILVNDFNADSYNEALDKLLTRKFDAEKIRKGAEEVYSLDKAVASYLTVYNKIFSKEDTASIQTKAASELTTA